MTGWKSQDTANWIPPTFTAQESRLSDLLIDWLTMTGFFIFFSVADPSDYNENRTEIAFYSFRSLNTIHSEGPFTIRGPKKNKTNKISSSLFHHLEYTPPTVSFRFALSNAPLQTQLLLHAATHDVNISLLMWRVSLNSFLGADWPSRQN